MERMTIYTDGSCEPNPGRTGWACIALDEHGQEVWQASGSTGHGTNNIAELTAIREALARSTGPVTIISDSQYCVNGMNLWRHKWKKRDWSLGRQPQNQIKNLVLWQELDRLAQDRKVSFKWVRGHNGSHWNELCDQLAEQARRDSLLA